MPFCIQAIIKFDQRFCLLMINRQAISYRIFCIIFSLYQRLTAYIIQVLYFWRIVQNMVNPP